MLTPFVLALTAALQRLDLSPDPRQTLAKLSKHRWTIPNTFPLLFMAVCALFSLYIMVVPFAFKLALPLLYATALLVPATSQFFLPATPVFAWLITFFTARFIPSAHRPTIHVALLPALESVLYGANISDLQTRYTNPILDVIAWLPYGVLHFALPFLVAIILWTLGPRGSIQYWGRAFGFMNLLGVLTQLVLPCAAPCKRRDHEVLRRLIVAGYEIIHGLTPANYAMPGSPGGLLRIDRVFHSSGYANTFGAAPLVFGAFPSLHSGCAVMEALFLSHFFPQLKALYWSYVGVLWWATMYLSHHYLIDLTGGASLSVLIFYLFMPETFKDSDQIQFESGRGEEGYEMVNGAAELDLDEEIRKLEESGEGDAHGEGEGDEEERVGNDPDGRKKVSWGQTKVLGESTPRQSSEV
jgi:hypothetical protein